VIVNPTTYTLDSIQDDENECEEIKQEGEVAVFDHDETVCALRIGDREEKLTAQQKRELRRRIR
jgi:hypothetical protein